jgi:itaconyl-CoA hydratase
MAIEDVGYVKLGDKRYREERGLYLDDFELGLVIEHRPGRTITLTDNVWQSLIAMNLHPLHIDKEYAAGTEFGQILVSSLVTFNIVNGMTVHSLSQKGIANLGWDEVRLLAPVFVHDTLYAESEIVAKRESKSRPGQGIVSARTVGANQRGEQVIRYVRTFMVPSRPARPQD